MRHFFSLISGNGANTVVSDRFTVRSLLTVELCVQEGFRVSRTPFTDDDRWGRSRMSHHSDERLSSRCLLRYGSSFVWLTEGLGKLRPEVLVFSTVVSEESDSLLPRLVRKCQK